MRRLADYGRDVGSVGRNQQQRGVAILRLDGVREWGCGAFFWGASICQFLDELAAAINDSSVARIVLMVDSPGGEVTGVREAAQAIYNSRGIKEISCYCSSMSCSAAYWISSACTSIASLPSAQIGSIGCYSLLFDESAALEKEGVKPWIFADPPSKVDMSGLVAPSKEAQQTEQAIVSRTYQDFLADVAKFRGVSKDKVVAKFGGGGIIPAPRPWR